MPVDALASALCWTKKAQNQNTLSQSHVHALGPIHTPHGAQKQKQQGVGVLPLFIVSSFRSEAVHGEPASRSNLQKPSRSLFVRWQRGGQQRVLLKSSRVARSALNGCRASWKGRRQGYKKKNCRPSSWFCFPGWYYSWRWILQGFIQLLCILQKLEKYCEDVKGKRRRKEKTHQPNSLSVHSVVKGRWGRDERRTTIN